MGLVAFGRAWRGGWCVVLGSHVAGAGDGRVPQLKPPTSEVSAGIDVTAHSWSVYSGFTSTFGGSILKDGWRYRITGGYGEYNYTSTRWTGASAIVVPFDGSVTFADILVGYQQTFGALTVKLFGGAAVQDHAITPFDVENRVQGQAWGAKGVVETWLNLGERAFGQLDLSQRELCWTVAPWLQNLATAFSRDGGWLGR